MLTFLRGLCFLLGMNLVVVHIPDVETTMRLAPGTYTPKIRDTLISKVDTTTQKEVKLPPVPVLTSNEVKLLDIVPKKTRGAHSREELVKFLVSGKTLERAYQTSIKTEIPVSVLLAQTILESNMAKSTLTIKTGNKGNIKCRCNRNDKLAKKHRSLETPVCVRGYDKIEKSNDYYEIIPTDWQDWNKRAKILNSYRVVRKAKEKGLTWVEWTGVLHKSPYATDKTYDKKLQSIIRAYGLNHFDNHLHNKITSTSGKFVFWEGKTSL